MTHLITVDRKRCTVCGICADVCPIGVLDMEADGPATTWESCIACGHCVASCPHEALTHGLAPLAGQMPRQEKLDPDAAQATEFLRSRRSVRNYLDTPVEPEKLRALLDIGRYAPSGGNKQGVSWLVVCNADVRKEITRLCVGFMDEWFKTAPETPMIQALQFLVNRYHQTGRDVILCGAPCVAVTMADAPEVPTQRDSAVMALLYTQLFAPVLGLATCWAGFVEYALRASYRPLLDALELPEGKIATGAMMVGYPKYRHKRLPERNPLDLIIR